MIRRIARRGVTVAAAAGKQLLRLRMWAHSVRHQTVVLAPDSQQAVALRFLAVGRQGYGNRRTATIAASMDRVAREAPTHAVLYLGDNFYPRGVASASDRQWQHKFERLYSGSCLRGMPFFAVVGNHDAEGALGSQVEYSRGRHGSARWQMENLFYTRDFGRAGNKVLLRAVFLNTVAIHRDPAEQLQFMRRAFLSATPAVWRIVVGHYGVRSLTAEPYTRRLTLSSLLPELQALDVDLYLSANDRFQQILDRPGEPLHVSANGGGDQGEEGLIPEDPGSDFVISQGGFAVLAVDERAITVELRDAHGRSTYQRTRER